MGIFSYEKNAKQQHRAFVGLMTVYRDCYGETVPEASKQNIIAAVQAIQKGSSVALTSNIEEYLKRINYHSGKAAAFLGACLATCMKQNRTIERNREWAADIITKCILMYCPEQF